MSAITSDWPLIGIETPNPQAVKRSKEYRRDEEFRSTLDSYIDGYRKHRTVMIGSTGSRTGNTHFLRSLAGWIRR